MVRLSLGSFVPLLQLRDDFDRAFKSLFDVPDRHDAEGAASGYPALNLWEENDGLKVEAEVPGLKSDDLEISVVGGELSIQGKVGGDSDDGRTFHRRERTEGAFRRVVRLPFDVQADQVEARLRDGVLLVSLPKAAAARPHRIKVETA